MFVRVCALGVGRAGITQLSFRSGHIYALSPLVDQKVFFFVCVFLTHTHGRDTHELSV